MRISTVSDKYIFRDLRENGIPLHGSVFIAEGRGKDLASCPTEWNLLFSWLSMILIPYWLDSLAYWVLSFYASTVLAYSYWSIMRPYYCQGYWAVALCHVSVYGETSAVLYHFVLLKVFPPWWICVVSRRILFPRVSPFALHMTYYLYGVYGTLPPQEEILKT